MYGRRNAETDRVSMDSWLHKQKALPPHNGILLRLQKEGNSDTRTARINLEGVMRWERSQSQKEKY